MRQFPKLRPCGWDALVVVLVVVLTAICSAVVWGNSSETDELTVVVSVDGKVAERCALENFSEGEHVYSNNGYTLYATLTTPLDPDDAPGILVKASDCPTQDCVHTGTITRAGQSIVCLPARVAIQLEGSDADNGVDAVVG